MRFSRVLRARLLKKTTRSADGKFAADGVVMARDGGATTGFICVDKDGYGIKRR